MTTVTRTLIIVPILNDKRSLARLMQELVKVLGNRPAVSMLVVDDGSVPPIKPEDFAGSGALDGHILTLSRNLGHQKAIAIGLAHAVSRDLADTIVVMDGDGEDRPAELPRLLAAFDTGTDVSIVVAQRARRSETLAFRISYQLYRLLFLVLTGHSISFGNFSALSKAAATRLVAMSELWTNYPATLIRSRLRIVEIPTERGARYHDQPRMNLVSLVMLGFGAVAVFLESALTRMILAASCLVALCLVASSIALGLKLVGLATPGWVTTVIGASLILTVAVAILSFVGLALSILAGSHTIPAPKEIFASFIAQTTAFGPEASVAAHRSTAAERS